MKRLGQVLKLKPGRKASYRACHAAVRPEVLERIEQCNIRNCSIFLKGNTLFGYFEYQGDELQADFKKMAEDKRTQEWWTIMEPMQDPLPDRKPGEWWASMDEVFHLD